MKKYNIIKLFNLVSEPWLTAIERNNGHVMAYYLEIARNNPMGDSANVAWFNNSTCRVWFQKVKAS